MNSLGADIAACDREPIHVPGSIQPHGALLVVCPDDLTVSYAAGHPERMLGRPDWHGCTLADLFGPTLAEAAGRVIDGRARGGFIGQVAGPSRSPVDILAHSSGNHLIIEIEPASPAPLPSAAVLADLEAAVAALERSPKLQALCQRAAVEFRTLTGYDRVMVYQFLDDGSGAVLAEDRRPDLHSFLNHHFPASDIPRQARALYLRNLVRVIPDVAYEPAPLQPAWTDKQPLDMSDCVLRSVSPVHLQYLRNMGVRASASISIVKDGALWGLVACHHDTPLRIPFDIRAACRALGGALAGRSRAARRRTAIANASGSGVLRTTWWASCRARDRCTPPLLTISKRCAGASAETGLPCCMETIWSHPAFVLKNQMCGPWPPGRFAQHRARLCDGPPGGCIPAGAQLRVGRQRPPGHDVVL
jgi:light-regulated signal transduction histidine kinase (bacteriophytochrome)